MGGSRFGSQGAGAKNVFLGGKGGPNLSSLVADLVFLNMVV